MLGRCAIASMLLLTTAVHAATPLPPHVNADGPQQPVIYFEQSGSTGAGGAAKVTTCKSLCPSPVNSKTCRVEGNPDRDGEFSARSWRVPMPSPAIAKSGGSLRTKAISARCGSKRCASCALQRSTATHRRSSTSISIAAKERGV